MGGYGANHEALCQGEDTEEDEVAGSLAAHVTVAGTDEHEQQHQAHHQRQDVQPLVFSAAITMIGLLVLMLSMLLYRPELLDRGDHEDSDDSEGDGQLGT